MNKLQFENSPYLLGHADDPVDWLPWGTEAFEAAEKNHKPIFLSIGYSTCHWCHVMARESFQDETVADLLNRAFICVKVDREERPDVDAVYMAAAVALNGSGGWPLTVLRWLLRLGRTLYALLFFLLATLLVTPGVWLYTGIGRMTDKKLMGLHRLIQRKGELAEFPVDVQGKGQAAQHCDSPVVKAVYGRKQCFQGFSFISNVFQLHHPVQRERNVKIIPRGNDHIAI